MNNVILPMIRKVMPNIIANQILGVQPMAAGTGSIFNMAFGDKKYNKKYWPYQYTVDRAAYKEAERWCWERFKGRYWSSSGQRFAFKRSEDAAIFALRWS